MQTLPLARDGGTNGDVGDRTAKPRNMKVRTRTARSGRSEAKTTTTCSHINCSSAASRRATNASRDPSGSTCGGNAMYNVRPLSTASHGCRAVRNVSRLGGGEPLASPGASGPPQRPGTQRHIVAIGLRRATGGPFTVQQRRITTHYSRHSFVTLRT